MAGSFPQKLKAKKNHLDYLLHRAAQEKYAGRYGESIEILIEAIEFLSKGRTT